MTYADDQALGASVGARADAAIADLTSRNEGLTTWLSSARTQADAAVAQSKADTAALAAAQADLADVRQQLQAAKDALAKAQQPVTPTPAPTPAPVTPAPTPTPAPAPVPAGPNGVEPTVAGAKSITAYAGATLTERASKVPAGAAVTLPPGRFSARDFRVPANYPVYGHFLNTPGQLLGSGVDQTILTLDPSSLTFGGTSTDGRFTRPDLAKLVEPGTDPYYLLRTDKASLIQDLTLLGTVQGSDPTTGKEYSYHGLQVYGTKDPTLRRVKIVHIPGSKGVPPNETFPLYFYRCSGLVTLEDVLIDGDGVGSSGVSGQPADGVDLAVLLRRTSIKGGPNGAGWTSFNRPFAFIRAIDLQTIGSLVGMNFEHVNVHGGAANSGPGEGIVLVRPDFRQPSGVSGLGYKHLAIDASSAAGDGVSNRIDIYDPLPEGKPVSATNKFGVTISSTYGYPKDGSLVKWGPQAQRGADVHLWVGGTWVETDPATGAGKYVGGQERNDLIAWTRTQGAA